MTKLISNRQQAKKFAKKYCPTFYQQFEDIRDMLTPIIRKGVKRAEMSSALITGIKSPTLYYKVQEDKDWYYISYMKYHPFDWSDRNLPHLIKGWVDKLDSHRHDSEAMCVRVAKTTGWGRIKGRTDIATVSHFSILFKKRSSLVVVSENQGHGIAPYEDSGLMLEDKVVVMYSPKSFNLINFEDLAWEDLKKEFNASGVNLPDQQYDKMLCLRFRNDNRPGGIAKPGDIWNRPDVLFNQAERINRI